MPIEEASVRCISNFAELRRTSPNSIVRSSGQAVGGVHELLCFLQSFWTIAPRLRGNEDLTRRVVSKWLGPGQGVED